jgi:hypothetical protein
VHEAAALHQAHPRCLRLLLLPGPMHPLQLLLSGCCWWLPQRQVLVGWPFHRQNL